MSAIVLTSLTRKRRGGAPKGRRGVSVYAGFQQNRAKPTHPLPPSGALPHALRAQGSCSFFSFVAERDEGAPSQPQRLSGVRSDHQEPEERKLFQLNCSTSFLSSKWSAWTGDSLNHSPLRVLPHRFATREKKSIIGQNLRSIIFFRNSLLMVQYFPAEF